MYVCSLKVFLIEGQISEEVGSSLEFRLSAEDCEAVSCVWR